MEIIGRPSINPVAFYSGKLAIAGIIVLALFLEKTGPAWLQYVSTLIFAVGLGIFAAGVAALRGSLRVGLAREATALKTSGIYRYSRNPIYVGVFLLCFSMMLSRLSVLMMVLFVIALIVHHRIVLAEERFLAERFGAAWDDYAKNVPRYS